MVMLGTYVILDGYDFGAGIVHLFFAKTKEKKAVTNAIGPFGMPMKCGSLPLEACCFLHFLHFMLRLSVVFICL